MSVTDVTIRPWIPGVDADLPTIAALLEELGYPTAPDVLRARLLAMTPAIVEGASDLLLARDAATQTILGLLHVEATVTIESDPEAEIRALVVGSAHRGRRIGQQLVDAAKDWARARGFTRLRVRTNEIRTGAHRFYEREGFAHTKSQRTYIAPLTRETVSE